jgi:hypothetical protein
VLSGVTSGVRKREQVSASGYTARHHHVTMASKTGENVFRDRVDDVIHFIAYDVEADAISGLD